MTATRKYIVDTTLRDGEQAPGVVFFNYEKLEIANALDQMGIEELEIGTPAMGKEEIRDMAAIVASKHNFKTIAWCRATMDDLKAAIETGGDAVNISFPVSHVLLAAMDRDTAWVINRMETLIAYAKQHFSSVYVGAQDASRAERSFLNTFCTKSLELGADRIRIADTVGVMNPISVKTLFEELSSDFPGTDFEFHPHNDMGMATDNALTALMSGASGVSCTVNGLGERAGNASLEELIVAMDRSILSGQYDLTKINVLSKMVERYSGTKLPASKPIVGANAFVHESGIHTRCMLKDKLAYQPFDEALVGHSGRFVIGKHSGKASVDRFFKEKGISLNAVQLMRIMNHIKSRTRKTKVALDPGHLLEAYQKTIIPHAIP